MRRLAVSLLTIFTGSSAVLLEAPALATPPGTDGPIAFRRYLNGKQTH